MTNDRLDPGETFLCSEHSRRITPEPNCEACANEKRHTQTERRVAALESRVAELEDEAGGQP